jgi:hypothetical protein
MDLIIIKIENNKELSVQRTLLKKKKKYYAYSHFMLE